MLHRQGHSHLDNRISARELLVKDLSERALRSRQDFLHVIFINCHGPNLWRDRPNSKIGLDAAHASSVTERLRCVPLYDDISAAKFFAPLFGFFSSIEHSGNVL